MLGFPLPYSIYLCFTIPTSRHTTSADEALGGQYFEDRALHYGVWELGFSIRD